MDFRRPQTRTKLALFMRQSFRPPRRNMNCAFRWRTSLYDPAPVGEIRSFLKLVDPSYVIVSAGLLPYPASSIEALLSRSPRDRL